MSSCPAFVNEEGVGGALTQAEIPTGLQRNSSSPGPPAWRRGRIRASRALPPLPNLRPSRRGRGTRASRPRGGGGCARSLRAWPGRAGPGWDPGVSLRGCPLLRGRPGPAHAGAAGSGLPAWAGGAPRPPPSGPGSAAGSARARGQAALTRGRRPAQCRPGALPCPGQQRGAPSPLQTMTIWVQLIHLEWGGRRV